MKILVADSSHLVSSRIAAMIRRFTSSTEVLEAGDYSEAQEIVRRENPELILVDMFLSGGNALKMLTDFRSTRRICHVVVLMHDANDELAQDCLRSGADYVFLKSEDLYIAIKTIGRLIGTSSPEKQIQHVEFSPA